MILSNSTNKKSILSKIWTSALTFSIMSVMTPAVFGGNHYDLERDTGDVRFEQLTPSANRIFANPRKVDVSKHNWAAFDGKYTCGIIIRINKKTVYERYYNQVSKQEYQELCPLMFNAVENYNIIIQAAISTNSMISLNLNAPFDNVISPVYE